MSTSMRKTLGWIIAAIGGLALLPGLCLGALALILQLTDPIGPSNNLQGFLVVFGVCPVPLIVVGIAALDVGLIIVYLAHKEERRDRQ